MPDALDPIVFRHLAGLRTPQLAGAELRALRHGAGLDLATACLWSGRHRTTLARMETGATRPDLAWLHLLLVLGGWLPWEPWGGWTVRSGALTSPEDARRHYTPGELELVTFAWQTAAAARAELRRRGVPEVEVLARAPDTRAA